MSQQSNDGLPKKNYSIIVTTIISIAATIIVGWLTLKYGANKYEEAEFERKLKVEGQIVRLIEQNIIDQTPLEIVRLKRLIEAKCRVEKISNNFLIKELVEAAELNLSSSDYLDKNQKEKYKQVFDSIYTQITPNLSILNNDTLADKNSEVIKTTITAIQECDVKKAVKGIDELLAIHNKEIKNLKKQPENSLIMLSRNYKKYYYFTLWQVLMAASLLLIFQIYGRRIMKDINPFIYRKVFRILIVYISITILPLYFFIISDIFNK